MAAKGGKSLRKRGKNVGDFLKNVGDFSANVRVLGRDGGENSPQVGQRWENRWKGVPPLVQPSPPSGATFAPVWCSFYSHLMQPLSPSGAPSPPSGAAFRPSGATSPPSGAAFAPVWCSLHPKEGRINKTSALGLVGKICIFAATSYRCGAHRIVPSRVPRKALSTRRSLCPLPDHRWAATTSILILP